MELEKLKKVWKDGIADGDIGPTLEDIRLSVDSKCHRINDLLTIVSNFNKTNKDSALNVIDPNTSYIYLSRISKSILDFIDLLEPKDLINEAKLKRVESSFPVTREEVLKLVEDQISVFISKLESIPNSFPQLEIINNKILIVSSNQGILTLKPFFNYKKFNHIDFCSWDILKDHPLIDVDLVIFDNRDVNFDTDERRNIMIQALNDGRCYFIHFGGYLSFLTNYPDRLITVNSIFLLFGRVKEMIDFINTYKVMD